MPQTLLEAVMNRTETKSNVLAALTYAVGDLLTKGAKFLLLPVYLAFLSPAEIGSLAILQAVSLSMTPLFANGLSSAVSRFYGDHGDDAENFVAMLFGVGVTVSGIGVTLIATVLAGVLPIIDPSLGGGLIALWMFSGFLRANSTILERRYMIRGEAMKYRTLTTLQFALSSVVIIALLSLTELRLSAIAIGEAVGYGSTLVYLAFGLISGVTKRLSWNAELTRYVMPLVIHAFAMFGLSYADRVVLGTLVPMDRVGVYHVGYLLATVVSTIGLAVRAAWLPKFFRDAAADSSGGEAFSNWLSGYVGVMTAVAASVLTIVPAGATWIIGPAYAESMDVTRVAAIALVFHSMMSVLFNPLYYAKRTGRVATIAVTAMVGNIVALYVLVPPMGIIGGAVASVVSYATAAMLTGWQASRHYQFRPQRRLWLSNSVVLVTLLVATLVPQSPTRAVVAGLIAYAIYAATLVIKPHWFTTADNIERLRRRLRLG